MKRVDKSTKKIFLIACCFQTLTIIIKCGILTFKTLHAHWYIHSTTHVLFRNTLQVQPNVTL